MRNFILVFTLSLFISSCSDSEETGFLGEWEGTIITIDTEGQAVQSESKATITELEDTKRECDITLGGLVHRYDAYEAGDVMTYSNEAIKNVSDSLFQTYISGTMELIGDTLIQFDHLVYVMDGSVHISSTQFEFEMKRK